MDLKQLEYFVSAAEELNFSRAATRCHVVQSAISASIKGLERELDVRLFDRSTHRVSLTHEGRVLLERSREVFRAVDAARASVARPDGELRGTVRIGVTQGAWRGMTETLTTMRREHPHVTVMLRQAPAGDLFRDVNAGDLDVAVVPLRKAREPGLVVRELYRERLVAVAPPGSGIAAHPEVSLASLAREDFIDFCGQWALRDIVDGAFDRAAVVRNGRYEVNDVTVGFSLVEAGLGVMVVPDHLAERETGLARLAIQGDLSWRIGAITPSRAGSALAAAVVELLV